MEENEKVDKRKRLPRALRLTFKVLAVLIIIPLALLFMAVVLLYLPPVQNYAGKKLEGYLAQKLETRVELGAIHLGFPLGLSLENAYLETPHGDTLVYGGSIAAGVKPLPLLNNRVSAEYLHISNLVVNLEQGPDSAYNYEFITKAFSDSTQTQPPDTSSGSPMSFGFDKIELNNIRYRMDLAPSDMLLKVKIGNLGLEGGNVAPENMHFGLAQIAGKGLDIDMKYVPVPDTTSDPYPNLTPPMKGIHFQLGNLDLADIRYSMKVRNAIDSTALEFGDINLDMEHLDLPGQRVEIDELTVDRPSIFMITGAPKEKPDTLNTGKAGAEAAPEWTKYNDAFRYFVRDWRFKAREMSINQGQIAMHSGSVKPPAGPTDTEHMVVDNLNLGLNNLAISNSLIKSGLSFSAQPPRMKEISLNTRFQLDSSNWQISRLKFRLPNSSVEFNAAVSPGEPKQLYEHYPDARFSAELKAGSTRLNRQLLASLDSAMHGIKLLEPWNLTLKASGRAGGVVNSSVDFKTGHNTRLTMRANTREITKWPQADFKIQELSAVMGADLQRFIQQQAGDSTLLPKRLHLMASAQKTGANANADLDVATDLGDISTNLSTTGWTDSVPSSGEVSMQLNGIDLEKIAGDSLLGKLTASLDGSFSGLGSSTRAQLTLQADSAKSNSLLNTLFLQAGVQGDSASAQMELSHPFAQVNLDADAVIDTASGTYSLVSTLDVDTLLLDTLGLVQQPLGLITSLNIEGTYRKTGQSTIKAKANRLKLLGKNERFNFDSLIVDASYGRDSIYLNLNSPPLAAHFFSNLPADSLMAQLQGKLGNYFLPSRKRSFVPDSNARMNMSIGLQNPGFITKILMPKIEKFDLDTLYALYNGGESKIEFNLQAPLIVYSGIELDSLGASLTGEEKLTANAGFGHISSDSLYVDNLLLSAVPQKDALGLRLSAGNEEEKKGGYTIPAILDEQDGALHLSVQDGLVLNGKPWQARSGNYLAFAQELRSHNFSISRQAQQLKLQTGGDSLRIDLDGFQLAALTSLVQSPDSSDLVNAVANGYFSTQPGGLGAKIDLDRIKYKGNQVGNLHLEANGDPSKKLMASAVLSAGENTVKAEGSYSAGEQAMDAHANINLPNLNRWQEVLSSYLFKLEGGLNGEFNYASHRGKTQKMEGNLSFNKAKIGLGLTGSVYTLPSAGITVEQGGVRFNNFTVRDSAGNRFSIGGGIASQNFVDYNLDLNLKSDRFQFLNSTSEENERFYGDLWMSLNYDIGGTAEAPTIDGNMSILGDTDFTFVLPGSSVDMVKDEGIVLFTSKETNVDSMFAKKKNTALADSIRKSLPGIDIDMGISLDSSARFTMIIDPISKDRAVAQGSADLDFSYNPAGNMNLSGKYEITDGYYALNFYGLVKKQFDLVPGGTIVWTGDPYNGTLDLAARYTQETSPYPLVARPGVTLATSRINQLQQRVPFNVTIGIGGRINTPSISFQLSMDEDYRPNFPMVDESLQRLRSEDKASARNKQVFGLLVLGSFIQESGSSSPQGSGMASRAARSSVNGILSNQLNRLAGGALPGFDVSLGVNSYDQYSSKGRYTQTALDYNVSKSFLNERLTFEVGGSVGISEGQGQAAEDISETRAMEYAVIYNLTPDGRYKLRGFRENDYNLFDGQIFNTGVALIFTRDFEKGESPFGPVEKQGQGTSEKPSKKSENNDKAKEEE